MKNRLLGLGQQSTEDMLDMDEEMMYPDSFDENLLDTDPEMVLNEPSSSMELKQMALEKIKEKYLKPRE